MDKGRVRLIIRLLFPVLQMYFGIQKSQNIFWFQFRIDNSKTIGIPGINLIIRRTLVYMYGTNRIIRRTLLCILPYYTTTK